MKTKRQLLIILLLIIVGIPKFEAQEIEDLSVIQVNQIGYRPDDPKSFVSKIPATFFTIVDYVTDEVILTSTMINQGYDTDVEGDVYRGHFDELVMTGTYQIVLNSGEESPPFDVRTDVYNTALWLATRYFYLQRSGIAIHDNEVSGVTLKVGHIQPATFWGDNSGATLDVTGGWYDAGDYGRYMPTAAFSVSQLLHAFSINPDYFIDSSLNIPESDNALPDLLDEIRWELDWMLKMQREDGAVYHKVTTYRYPDYGILPDEDTEPLFIFDISSADTAYFAATTAQASLIYRPYDATYADKLLNAAEDAGVWLSMHPEQVPPGGFQSPPVDEYPMQGGYDFIGDEDIPRLWAAAELFKATGNPVYETLFVQHFAIAPQDELTMGWANSYPMALYAYLTADEANAITRLAVQDVFQMQAAQIFEVSNHTGYHVALTDNEPGFEYEWGSNQVTLAHGLYLMMANEFNSNTNYVYRALDQIHYILGMNPLAKVYVSGMGANSVLEPHHNVSFRFRQAVPGIITEGSNSQNTGGDLILEQLWDANVPPAMRYADNWDSWASNEPTIDANATFIALLAYFVP